MIRHISQMVIQDQLLQELVDNMPDVIYFKDLRGRLIYVNKAHAAGLGLAPEEVIGKTDYDFFPKELADSFTHDDRYVMITGQPIIDEVEYTVQPDGSKHVVSTTKYPRKDVHGNIIGLMGITRDITERTRLEEERDRIRQKAAYDLKRLKDQVENEKMKLEEIITIEQKLNTLVHFDQLIEYAVESASNVINARRCSLMLYDEQKQELALAGWKGPLEIKQKTSRVTDDAVAVAQMIVQGGKPVLVRDIEQDKRFARKNRNSYKTKSFISVPIKAGNNLIGIINLSDKNGADTDVFTQLDLKILQMFAGQIAVAIENARLYKELNFLTVSDPLTNMYNYRHFAKSLDHEIKRMRRYNEELCLLMIDLDNFKTYNDTLGHLEGDKLLRLVSNVLNENIREIDIACRYAGDEFVVILPKTGIPQALVVANKLKARIQKLSGRIPVTFSIGIAQCRKDMDRHQLTLMADKALYAAKRNGKNKIVCSSG